MATGNRQFDAAHGNESGLMTKAGDVRLSQSAPKRHSPHLLNIPARIAAAPQIESASSGNEKRKTGNSFWKKIIGNRQIVDEAVACSLSSKPHGWRDFPPAEAESLSDAIRIMASRFLRNHSLSTLSPLAVARLVGATVWRMLTWPVRYFTSHRQERAPAPKPIVVRPLLPLMPLGVKAPAKAVVTTRLGAVKAKPLQVRQPSAWTRRRLIVTGALGVLALIVVVGLAYAAAIVRNKSVIMGQASHGAQNLLAAAAAIKTADFSAARQSFDLASDDFSATEKSLGFLGNMALGAAMFLPSTPLSTAGGLLTAGHEIGLAGSAASSKLAELSSAPNPADKVTLIRTGLANALPHLDRAAAVMALVDPNDAPPEYREEVVSAKDNLPKMVASAHRATAVLDLMSYVLGTESRRRLLLVFQNNAELRPTGGFIGSYALIDTDRGKLNLTEMPGGGSYDLRGGLRERLVSPAPLHLINPDWEFQDANWFADFPTSARKLAWFYEKSSGATADGVIAMNATLMESLLEVTGPIEMPTYGVTVDSRNFFFIAQKQAELDYDKTANKPKQFLADLAPKVIERMLAADQPTMLKMATVLDKALGKKDMLLWLNDENQEQRIKKLGWGGELLTTDGDYLSIVHTNIGGAKTDLLMKEAVTHVVKILPEGSAIDTLTISRTHTGVRDALFSGVRNVDYLRVYVPAGSDLVEATGYSRPDAKLFQIPDGDRGEDPDVSATEASSRFDRTSGVDVMNESGKTVFGGWVQTDPGKTSVITLVYKLPANAIRTQGLNKSTGQSKEMSYSLLVQKQPGANPAEFVAKTDWPRGFRPVWQSPEATLDEASLWSVSETLVNDRLFAAVAGSN